MLSLVEAAAQDLRALARVNPQLSRAFEEQEGVRLQLVLSQPIPYRVETRLEPMRFVIEFREADFGTVDPATYLESDLIAGVAAGPAREGWSQLELVLTQPLALESAEMTTDPEGGEAQLQIVLRPTDGQSFAAAAERGELGAPERESAATPPVQPESPMTRQRGNRPLIVMLDPGHGGFDPGAERDGVAEADLMLQFARELQDHLVRTEGYTVLLTRTEDEFVPLPDRVARAREAQADVFMSLHADALMSGEASGGRVYTLSDVASDAASAQLAEQLDRASLLAGMDLTAQDDTLATALMDLARTEVRPRSARLADELVAGITAAVGEMHPRPRMSADFSVLRAPDVPSVLVELGFMSSDSDLERLLSEEWRAQMAEGIRMALSEWALKDAVEAELLRQ